MQTARALCSIVLLAGACRGPEAASADAQASDADVASTDLVPAVGSAGTLDVACWNLREFPVVADSPRVVGDLIASMALDVVAVEEIESLAALEALVARMPGWQAALPTEPGSATGGIGVLWRTDAVTSSGFDLEVDADARFPRPVVRAVFELAGVTPPASFALHIVHFKAGTGAADEQTRVDQAAAVEDNVRMWVDGGDVDRVIVLGDFNEDSGDPRADEVFAPWTGAPDRYSTPTRALDDAGAVTFLPAGIMLDHMIATRALDAEMTDAPLIPALDEALPAYQATVSDHLPLVLRLQPWTP